MDQAAPPLTVAQIRQLFVTSPVPVVVGTLVDFEDYRAGVGKHDSTVQSATLRDDAGEDIRINIWNQQNYASRKGAKVRIVAAFEKGKCSTTVIENKHFNPPHKELQMTKNSVFLFAASSTTETAQDSSLPKQPPIASPAASPTPPGEAAPAKSDPVERQPPPRRRRLVAGYPVNGQTVGNSMKLAVDIVRYGFADQPANDEFTWDDYVKTPEFSRDLWERASDIIRIAYRLEDGDLAPSARERAKAPKPDVGQAPNPPPPSPPPVVAEPAPPPPKPVEKARPGPGGEAFPPSEAPDEDLPF
jgi:hypothetical protein